MMKTLMFLCFSFLVNFAFAAGPGSPAYFKEPSSSDELARIHAELGEAYFAKGSFSVALDELNRALSFNDKYVPALLTRAMVYNSMKEKTKTEEDFRRASKAEPKNPLVLNAYGWYLCENGDAKRGMEMALAAAVDPLYQTPALAYLNAGSCAINLGDAQRAETYIRQSMTIVDTPMAHYYQAKLLESRKMNPEAYVELKIALKGMEPPIAPALLMGIRLGKEANEDLAVRSYAKQLKSRYPMSQEWDEAMKMGY